MRLQLQPRVPLSRARRAQVLATSCLALAANKIYHLKRFMRQSRRGACTVASERGSGFRAPYSG
jgi:hypothetical protein